VALSPAQKVELREKVLGNPRFEDGDIPSVFPKAKVSVTPKSDYPYERWLLQELRACAPKAGDRSLLVEPQNQLADRRV
jgi:hypothetical protein